MDKEYKNLVKAHIIAVNNKSFQLWTECENLRKFINNTDILHDGLIIEYHILYNLLKAMEKYRDCIETIKGQLEDYKKVKEHEEEIEEEVALGIKGMTALTIKVYKDIVKILEEQWLLKYPAELKTYPEAINGMINIYEKDEETELENKISLEKFIVTKKGYDLEELKDFVFKAYNCVYGEKMKIIMNYHKKQGELRK